MPKEKRNAGRPRKLAAWYAAVARTMRDGTPLSSALRVNGVKLGKAESYRLYRQRAFQRMLRVERHMWPLEQSGRHTPEELDAIRKKVETFWP